MTINASLKFPVRVHIGEVLSSRYPNHQRPSSWELRKDGFDLIKTADGQHIKLWSDGGQSPPKVGWVIEITESGPQDSYKWTLYGIPSGSHNVAESTSTRDIQ